MTVRAGQSYDGLFERRRLRKDRAEDDQRAERQHQHRAQLPGSVTFTTNSVPRTPMIDDGVRTLIASGDCLTILPEMTASVPFFSEASKCPLCVVESNA